MTEAETRARILLTARELFIGRGLSMASMDELARRLGMSKRTIYRLYRSKRELAEAVVDAIFAEAEARIEACLDNGGESLEILECLVSLVRSVAGMVSSQALADLRFREPELWERICSRREKLIQGRIGGVVEAGKRSGAIRRELPTDVVVRIVVGVIGGVATPEAAMDLGRSIEDLVGLVADILIRGLRESK